MRDKLLSIFIFSCLCFTPLQAQESNIIVDMTPDDYVNLKLPPLDSLFENAKKSPTFQILDTHRKTEVSLLKKEKEAGSNF